MSTIHHFGDSYGVIDYVNGKKIITNIIGEYPPHFVELCAMKLNKQYFNYSEPGYSNEFILKKILKQINTFKKNDIIFVQFSYFCRGAWYNEISGNIENTNSLYDETYNNKYFERANNNQKLLSLVDYYLTYTEDYSRRIFDIINNVFEQLIAKGIFVYFIHIDDSNYVDSLLKYGFSIKFEKGFGKWLMLNKFHNEDEGHYTKHIQPMLSDIILKVTNNLSKTSGISDTIKLSGFNKKVI
jgi:hypothetical protein